MTEAGFVVGTMLDAPRMVHLALVAHPKSLLDPSVAATVLSSSVVVARLPPSHHQQFCC
jgi:hypothetical protein